MIVLAVNVIMAIVLVLVVLVVVAVVIVMIVVVLIVIAMRMVVLISGGRNAGQLLGRIMPETVILVGVRVAVIVVRMIVWR